ncbi:DUF4082 domain-containing protein [Nocardioides currus]|uniref:DUF4082 domain-containing protein n=1 Tax=Nocardioides currus TaxID=2133958 RepID=UPI001401FC4D|nr:DUF4082 domain-containing protein [Nocardioides currus]
MKHTPALAPSARPAVVVAVLAALAATLLAVLPRVDADAAAGVDQKTKQASVGIWDDSVVPATPSRRTTKSTTLGLDFSSETGGRLYGIQYYAAGKNRAATTGKVWNARGKRLATVHFDRSKADGWKTAWFSSPVKIRAGKTYTASYRAPKGRYAIDKKSLGRHKDVVANGLTAHRGTFSRGPGRPTKTWRGSHYFIDVAFVPKSGGTPTQDPNPTPNPTPTTPVPSAFPDASNTGVPDGVALGTYAGPTTITAAGTVIDAQQINGSLVVRAPVTITRSQVNGVIVIEGSGHLTMADSTVDGGTSENSAISQRNMTLRRVEVKGARASVGCDLNCDVQDSWLHAQYMPAGSDWHGDGFLSNGGSNMVLRHNTLACDSKPTGAGGACSAALAAYGDFSPITNMTVDNNLFVQSPAGYCMYAGADPAKPYGDEASNIVVTNNVFARGTNGKCAAFGPVAAVAEGGNGNVFSGNVWDDGKAVSAP